MKVTNIDIQVTNVDDNINLSFRDPTSQNAYIAKEILGLDAEEITPRYYGSSLFGTEKYYDLAPKKRDIVLKISLNPNFSLGQTYSNLRDDLYKAISSSRTGAITLLFKDVLTTVASVSGFITKLESPTFTKNPEVHITLNCIDPLLKAVDVVNVSLVGLDPSSTTIIDNESTAPHGFKFGVEFTGTVSTFSVKDAAFPNWLFEIYLTGSSLTEFVAGDQLHFSSERNNQYVYLLRGVTVSHLADKLIGQPIWPIIFPGENVFICSGSVTWEYISYYPTYWGV